MPSVQPLDIDEGIKGQRQTIAIGHGDAAFTYAATISTALLQGDTIKDSLEQKDTDRDQESRRISISQHQQAPAVAGTMDSVPRKWLTQAELLGKYGDASVVDAIVQAKLADPEVMASHVRSIRNIQLPEGRGARGAASLRFFYENLVSIRRFMLHDVMGLLREQSKKGQLAAVDSLSLQLESYRVIGYRDIAPQYKVWCIFHCNLVARKVLSILESPAAQTIQKHIRNLNKLQQTYSIRDAILSGNPVTSIRGGGPDRSAPAEYSQTRRQSNNNDKVPTRRSDRHSTERAMQLTSHWVRSYSSFFPTVPASMKVVRKAMDARARDVSNDLGIAQCFNIP
ncbi:unnamed protein product [Cladocopium goreaui]|uniref:Uncharacterized protein n=1 Tax=Cladocopium goreaui TaxID=2562237 RepID=A0A9P1CMX3_9DINO|nr:unnamed protein product [Cladocopium goreaui]